MLAAIATAIEKRMTCWNNARRPDRSRSTDGASTGAMSLASCMACATALVNISESWRRAGLPNGCKGGPSVGIRGRHPSFCTSDGLGCSPVARSLNSRGA